MGCIIARHVAAAVTARGGTTAEEHKALNARITLHPTDVLLSLNSSFFPLPLPVCLFFFSSFLSSPLFDCPSRGVAELV